MNPTQTDANSALAQ